MKFSLIKTNLTVIQKICLAGLFMALTIILQKVVAINYLAFAPFVRISFGGPALIIFASILLGPVYGAFIGLGSDLFGYLIFDPRMYPPYLQITAIYTLLGFLAYYIFSFVSSIKNQKALSIIEIIILSAIWLATSLYVILSQSITLFSSTYEITLLSKILVPSILGVIFIVVILFSNLYKPKTDNQVMSPLQICFASFVCDILVIVLFGSIILCQAMVLFVNVMLDTLFISAFLRFSKKYFVNR